MNSSIIAVEGLGKKYRLNHGEPRRYTALRDVIANNVKLLLRGSRTAERNGFPKSEEFWALKDVSFEIKEGEVVGIIGRNGAGKSTLLKILSRITEPTTGQVRIRGRVASLLEVGTGFHPELTGRENIYLNGAILGMSRAEIKSKFDEIVAFAEVEKFLDTPVKHYSSGMYVRLAFAVAAHLEPEILVVDEVLAVGDAKFQKKCLGKMGEMARGGRTVLFVSHNMGAVRTLCSRALLIDRGEVNADGSVGTIIESYRNTGIASTVTSTWNRPADCATVTPLFFNSIKAQLQGRQPRLILAIAAKVACNSTEGLKVLAAVDLCDGIGTPILQAMPVVQPIIEFRSGNYLLKIEIDLPALIPGHYTADLWLGSHHTETLDYVRHVISIAIEESPVSGRTFPYGSDHGFMMSSSRYQCQSLGPAESYDLPKSDAETETFQTIS